MENLDLDINNYNLNDLLNLFQLPMNFSEEHLKNAKKIVLKSHPDKSGLDKKYFLFFSQAYKNLFHLYNFKKGSETKNTDYYNDDLWETDNSVILDNKTLKMSQKEYNKWFNETFEKLKGQIDDDNMDNGYGDWLKEKEEVQKANNAREMNEIIEKKKESLRALVVHKDIVSYDDGGGFDILKNKPDNYSSSVFGKLQFEDLKKAHDESVIPVTQEDYMKRKKYSNIDEISRDRFIHKEELNNMYSTHEKKINEQKNNDDSITRAYTLMKQDEKNKNIYNKFWSDMKKINNK